MALEDFTTYTEVDPNSHIGLVGTDHIDVDGIKSNETAYLYKDKGAGHFTDFEHLINLHTVSGESNARVEVWALANTIDDWRAIYNADGDMLSIMHAGINAIPQRLALIEVDGGNYYQDLYDGLVADTWYYLTIKRDGTTFTCKIYSDSSRETLVDTLTLTLHTPVTDFRYIYPTQTDNIAVDVALTCDIEDLDLQEGAVENLAGVSTGIAAVSGLTKVTHTLVGTIAGVASITGAASVLKKIAGAIAGVASVVGVLEGQFRTLAGVIAGAASVAGDLPITKKISGLASGIASVTGALTVGYIQYLAGVVSGVASVVGNLSISGIKVLAGIINGVASVTGSLPVTKKIAGVVAGVASVSGVAKITKKLAGAIAGVATVTAGLTVKIIEFLAGVISGVATVAGVAKITKRLTGTSAGVAAVSGATKILKKIAGVVSGVASVAGALTLAIAGRVLKITVVTMQYRTVKVATMQYRTVKAITTLYRKIKAFTTRG